MTTKRLTRKHRRAPRQREGIVMLIVMLMLMMATGTAMFAIQATQYEQRSATAVGEANWARGLSECTTMAALAYAEDRTGNGGTPPTLSAEWMANGSERAIFSRKYAFPEPGVPNALLAGPPPDPTGSTLLAEAPNADVAPFASNAQPRGLVGFLPTERSRISAYPQYRNHDSQYVNDPGLRYYRTHWLQETLVIRGAASKRTRTVVTGFAEVHVWGDPLDSSGVRDIHELDAISRGYIDKIE